MEHAAVIARVAALPDDAPLFVSPVTIGEMEYGYRTQSPRDESREAEFRAFVHEYRFRWSTVRGIFRECQLFDFTEKVWHRFDDAALLSETRITAPLNSGQLSYTSS